MTRPIEKWANFQWPAAEQWRPTEGNLRWATQAQNIADKVLHRTEQIGSRHPRAKVDEKRAARVKQLAKTGAGSTDISRSMGISVHIVRDIKRDRTWRHVR